MGRKMVVGPSKKSKTKFREEEKLGINDSWKSHKIALLMPVFGRSLHLKASKKS